MAVTLLVLVMLETLLVAKAAIEDWEDTHEKETHPYHAKHVRHPWKHVRPRRVFRPQMVRAMA